MFAMHSAAVSELPLHTELVGVYEGGGMDP